MAKYGHANSNTMNYDVGSAAAPYCFDLDQDGDVDCLIGNYDGLVLFFENAPSPGNPYNFIMRNANFFNSDVGLYAKPFCMDLDNDGKMDCLVGESTGYVAHFRYDSFRWTKITGNFFNFDFGDHAAPFCADMDGDGLVDCLVGRYDGTVNFLKRTSASLTGFTRQSQTYFGQRDFGSWATPFCADVDRDGVLECFVGNNAGLVSYMRQSRGGEWALESDNIFGDYGSYAAPTCADIDGDGHIDCLIGDGNGLAVLMRQKPLAFSAEGISSFLDVGSYSSPMCVDFDKDGRKDVVIGNSAGYVQHFRNKGNFIFERTTTNFIGNVPDYYAAPSCFDADGDGDIDCVVGTTAGVVRFQRNDTSKFTHVGHYINYDVGSYASPFCADMDGDGDVDCLVGNDAGVVWYFEKNGNSYNSFKLVTTNFFRYDVGSYATPACYDLHNDGKLDCLVGDSSGRFRQFRNYGTGAKFSWRLESDNYFGRSLPARSAISCADLDNDTLVDCLVGASDGWTYHMRQRPPQGPIFTRENFKHFSSATTGHAHPYCGDLDGDGLSECLIGDGDGLVQKYRNAGSAANPLSWSRQSTNFFSHDVGNLAAPFCFDVDGDGDMDCLVGAHHGYVSYFRNDLWSWTYVTSNFFSLDVGSYSVPFCADMDADGDIDCLVGTSSGQVYYFRRDGGKWTHAHKNYFGLADFYYAVPHCLDLDGDGDLDCLVGENHGRILHFQNDGTPSSPSWVLVTRDFLGFDQTTNSAPFCWDMDGDGDVDCFVGFSNGIVYTYKNHQTATVSHTVTTTQAPSTTPATPTNCSAGSYVRGWSCVKCAAGRYDTRRSSDSSTCASCPHCTSAPAGSTSCKTLAACWLPTVNGSSVVFSIAHDGDGLLHMRFKMPALPAASQLHGNHRLAYSADLQNETDRLSYNTVCGSMWKIRETEMEVLMVYEKFRKLCSVNQTMLPSYIRFNGHAAVLVRIITDSNRVIRVVSFPFEIRLPLEVAGAYEYSGMATVRLPWHTHHLAPYASSLRAFASKSFTTEIEVPVFREGETIFIEQSASVGKDWTLRLQWVWLSTSADPNDEKGVRANLTKHTTTFQGTSNSSRFSFSAVACQECYLHTVSRLVSVSGSNTRRLSGIINFAHTSLWLAIRPKKSVSMTEVSGAMDLAVADAPAFVTDPRTQQGVAIGLRHLLGLPSTNPVSVGLSLLTRRSSTTSLASEASVGATYYIMLPAAGAGNENPYNVRATLTSISKAKMAEMVLSGLSATASPGSPLPALDVIAMTSQAPPIATATEPPLTIQQPSSPPVGLLGLIDARAEFALLAFMGFLHFARKYWRTATVPQTLDADKKQGGAAGGNAAQSV